MSEIELILKSPTDRIAPFSLKCNKLWTIKQLKSQIKQIYPSKPSIESQKIIYVGKLLKDDQILKDIFEIGSSTIVHLICQSTVNEPVQKNPEPNVKMEPNADLYREYQDYVTNWYETTSRAYTGADQYERMVWLQQAYMHYYYGASALYCSQNDTVNSVINAETKTTAVSSSPGENSQASTSNDNPAAQQENVPNNGRVMDGAGEPNGVQNMMAAAFGGLMGDGGEDENDGEVEPRDLLHYFYMAVRFGLLLLICYYYSSVASVVTTLALFFVFFGVNLLRRNNNHVNQPIVSLPTPAVVREPNNDAQPETQTSLPSSELCEEVVENNEPLNNTIPVDGSQEINTALALTPSIAERLKQAANTSLQFVITFFVTLFPEPIAHIDIN